MSWQVAERVTIYHEEGMYALCPNVVRAPSGDLLTFFQRAPHLGFPHHNHPLFNVLACRSKDEGRTWSEPFLVSSDPLGGIMDRGVHTLSDGSIYMHASCTELVPADENGKDHGTSWISRPGIPFWVQSRDDGHTWSAPKRFPPVPGAVWGHPADHSGVCRSGLLELPDGRLLMPSKASDRPDGGQPYFGMLRISHDMGETWEYGGRIAEDPVAHFSEPTIHRTPGGRILVLFRCHARQPIPETVRDDPNVEAYKKDAQYGTRFLALVYSDDDGKTWSPWRRTIHGYPAHMLGLRDGRIFLTVGTRWIGRRGCIAMVLEPEGTDLETAPELVIESDSISQDCGYPWSVELNDGRVLTVYWHHFPDDHRGINGVIVEEV